MRIEYNRLPEATTDEIEEHFGLSFMDEDADQMKQAAKLDAKTPKLFFEPDSERRRTQASDAARSSAAQWLDPIYEQLENVRTGFSK